MKNSTDTRSDSDRHDDDRHDGKKSPQRLEREVDQARARLERTAIELSDRLSPGELMDQALRMAREHGGDFGRNLGAQVKNNPLPMILTSIGISWLVMSSGKKNTPHTHAKTTAKTYGNYDTDTNNDGRSLKDTREALAQFYRDQPLIAGSLGIAIGAALGALIPPSEMEDSMFGEARDRSVDAAKAKAESTYDDVRESIR